MAADKGVEPRIARIARIVVQRGSPVGEKLQENWAQNYSKITGGMTGWQERVTALRADTMQRR